MAFEHTTAYPSESTLAKHNARGICVDINNDGDMLIGGYDHPPDSVRHALLLHSDGSALSSKPKKATFTEKIDGSGIQLTNSNGGVRIRGAQLDGLKEVSIQFYDLRGRLVSAEAVELTTRSVGKTLMNPPSGGLYSVLIVAGDRVLSRTTVNYFQ